VRIGTSAEEYIMDLYTTGYFSSLHSLQKKIITSSMVHLYYSKDIFEKMVLYRH